MEGVVVSAKKDGSTMSISVVTDGKAATPSLRRNSSRVTTR